MLERVIFRAVGDSRPYPERELSSPRDWSAVPPSQVKLDQLVTTKSTLDLETLLSEDSTFFGDLSRTSCATGTCCIWRTGCTGRCVRRCTTGR